MTCAVLRRHAMKSQRVASERRHARGIITALRLLYHKQAVKRLCRLTCGHRPQPMRRCRIAVYGLTWTKQSAQKRRLQACFAGRTGRQRLPGCFCTYYTIKRSTLYGIMGMCRLRRHAMKFQRVASERRYARGIIAALRLLYRNGCQMAMEKCRALPQGPSAPQDIAEPQKVICQSGKPFLRRRTFSAMINRKVRRLKILPCFTGRKWPCLGKPAPGARRSLSAFY